MSEKKLYEVTVEYTFYAYAEDEDEACSYTDEAIRDTYSRDLGYAREVKHSDHPIAADWDESTLIYHEGREDMTLGSALEKLPPRPRGVK